jgi:Ca-activated chloride channel family protein
MKIRSTAVTAFLLAIAAFGSDQPLRGLLDPASVRATNDRSQEQRPRPASSRPKQNEDETTVRVDTTLVTVPVAAMDRDGKFVPGLRAEDFRVFEEGVEQEIAFFRSAEEPVTVALMLDVSDSAESNLREIRDAAITFVDQLRPDDRVTVIEFDSGLRELALATSDRQVIHNAIRSARTGGGTRLYDAVDFVLTKRLNQMTGRKAIILFTDGVDVDSRVSLEKSLRTIEEAGIFIYPIQYKHPRPSSPAWSAVGGAPQNNNSYRGDQSKADFYLRGIAKNTGARFYLAEDKKSLAKSFAQVADELRRQYDLGYYPTSPAKPGQRVRIKVTVKRPEVVVRSRGSYIYAPPGGVK